MNNKTHLTISEETEIDLPSTRKMMGVDRIAWSRLKKMVSRVSESQGYWQNSAWFASASAISFFIAAKTTTGFFLDNPNLLSMLSLVSVVAAVILFIADYAVGQSRKVTRQDILEQMQEIEIESTAKIDDTSVPIKAEGEKKETIIKSDSGAASGGPTE